MWIVAYNKLKNRKIQVAEINYVIRVQWALRREDITYE